VAAANGFVTERPDTRYGDTQGTFNETWIVASRFVAPGSGQLTITEIGLYAYQSPAPNVKLAIFTDDAVNGCPETMVSNSETGEITMPTSMGIGYYTYTTCPVVTGGNTYWIAVTSSDAIEYSRFASGGTTVQSGSQTYGVWPSASAWEGFADSVRDYSFYAKYTTAGGTTYEQAVGGTLAFSGGPAKRTDKALAGSFGFAGAVSKQSAKPLAGSLAFSGSATKITAKALAGTLTFSGAAAKLAQKALAGALSFAGSLASATLHMYYQAVGGVLAFSGGVQKVTQKSLGGVLAFGGGVAKLVTRALAGTISFTGNAAKLTQRTLSGAISFAGSLATSTGSAVMDGIMKVVVSARTAISRVSGRTPGASVGGRSPRADVSGRS